MRNIMMPMFKLMPGKSAEISVAASRYLEASEYPQDVTGQFFASAPKKLIGPLHRVELPTRPGSNQLPRNVEGHCLGHRRRRLSRCSIGPLPHSELVSWADCEAAMPGSPIRQP